MNYRKKAILMVMALFCLNVAILAQAVSLKMDNVSVKEAMTQLKNKSGYSFVYKVGDLDTKKIITVRAKELNEAIDQILYEQDVVYEVKGKNIIVQKRQAKQNTSKDGKKRNITGTVNDVNGEPIIGVTIKEKGTNNGNCIRCECEVYVGSIAGSSIGTILYRLSAFGGEGWKSNRFIHCFV